MSVGPVGPVTAENGEYKIRRPSPHRFRIDKHDGHVYTVLFVDGFYFCTCPGFHNRGGCRHVVMVEERTRLLRAEMNP